MHGVEKKSRKKTLGAVIEARKSACVECGLKYQEACHVQAAFSMFHSLGLCLFALTLVHCVGQ